MVSLEFMIEAPKDTTMEIGKLFIGEGTKAMQAIADAMESFVNHGEQIPPELVEAFKEVTGIVKTAIDHVLPIFPAHPDGPSNFKA